MRMGMDKAGALEIAQELDIAHILDRHPYDLSGGEMQKAALAKLLATQPGALLLDEPTKGLDPQAKAELGRLLQKRAQKGEAILVVTHDLEFAAAYGDACMLLFGGGLVCQEEARRFFWGNSFYTTAVHRMTRGYFPDCVLPEDILRYV